MQRLWARNRSTVHEPNAHAHITIVSRRCKRQNGLIRIAEMEFHPFTTWTFLDLLDSPYDPYEKWTSLKTTLNGDFIPKIRVSEVTGDNHQGVLALYNTAA